MTSRNLLLKILDTIGYTDNKEPFINQFFRNLHLQTLLDLIQTLPADKQIQVRQKIKGASQDPDSIVAIMKDYFPELHLQQALQKSSKNAIERYLSSIGNTLTTSQKENLVKVIEEFVPQNK